MSVSLLKKSLKLFEESTKSDKLINLKRQPGKGKRCALITNKSAIVKTHASLKDRKVKSAIDTFVKKHSKQDKTCKNLELLEKVQKQPITQDSAKKVH